MVGARDDEQIEALPCLDERVHDLHGGGGVHVAIHLAHNQHELALEAMRVVHVGGCRVFGSHRPAHPLLIPPDLVHAVVV